MLRLSGNCLYKFRLNAFKNFNKFPIKNFYFQETSHGAGEPHIIAKRVINVVGQRLREIDANRWDGVPVTYETKWVDEDNYFHNIRTCVLIHDILEREFNIDIEDKKILLGTIRECVAFVLENHASV